MDKLALSALKYSELLGYEYIVVLGRKGKTRKIRIIFSEDNWFHICGLHKLEDIAFPVRHKDIFNSVLKSIDNNNPQETIYTYDHISKSLFFECNHVDARLDGCISLKDHIEHFDNQRWYDFDRWKLVKEFYTTIDANLLVESSLEKPIRLFIFFKNKDMAEVYVNVTAFPEDKRDFTKYQTQWTLLCAQTKCISSGEVVELFRAKSFSE